MGPRVSLQSKLRLGGGGGGGGEGRGGGVSHTFPPVLQPTASDWVPLTGSN